MPIGAFTEDDIEAFFGHLRAAGFAASTRNKYIQTVKALFRWATKKGYLTRNPAGDSDVLKREQHARRDRRLLPDVVNEKGQIEHAGEERRLLAAAGPHLQRVMIGRSRRALDGGSCCRCNGGTCTWIGVR